MIGRRLVAIMVGAPAPRTLAMVSTTSHHRQWSGVSLKIGGEERWFLFQLAGDWNSKVNSSSPRFPLFVLQRKSQRPLKTHARNSARSARHPSRTTPHSLRVGTEPTSQLHRSARCGRATRKVSHHDHDFKNSVALNLRWSNPNKPTTRCNSMCGMQIS
jgi:hypothetical protein